MNEDLKYRISLEDLFSRGIQEAEKSASNFESTISSLQSKAVQLFAGFQAFSFAQSVVDVGSSFESAEVGLTTLLKSSSKAHDVFEQVKKDAQETPFDVQSLLMSNKSLISAGVNANKAREDVLNLANAVSATGGGNDELQRMVVNLQQIKNAGKATGVDIKQFAYAGINIYTLLADSLGKSTAEVKKMDISYEMLTAALKKAHEAGGLYEGGLERMSGTTSVMLSNLGDAWNNFKNEVFLQNKETIDSAIKHVMELIKWLNENIDTIKNLVIAIGSTVAAFKTLSIIKSIRDSFILAKTATEGLTVSQWALNGAMAANPIGLMAAAIGALVFGIRELIDAYNAVDEAKRKMTPTEDAYKQAGQDELIFIRQKTDELMKLKKVSEEVAQAEAIKLTRDKLLVDQIDAQGKLDTATSVEDMPNVYAEGQRKNIIKYQQDILKASNLKELLKQVKMPKMDASLDLGSGLSEPKASSIKNITININSPFNNQKVTVEGGAGMDIKELAPKFTEYLISLVEDAAIIATE